jgi:hypothetical protein
MKTRELVFDIVEIATMWCLVGAVVVAAIIKAKWLGWIS